MAVKPESAGVGLPPSGGKLNRQLVDLLRQSMQLAGSTQACNVIHSMQHLWGKCRRTGAKLVPGAHCAALWRRVHAPCSHDLNELIGDVCAASQQQQFKQQMVSESWHFR